MDEAFAQAVYHRSNIVGKKIEVELEGKPVSFEVVGVVKTGVNLMQNMMGMGAAGGQDAGQDEEEESPDGDGSGEERFVPGGAGTFPLGIFSF